MLLVGYPGSAKTGSLVSLINAGYKLRILDFDGNIDPILRFAASDKLANVDIVTLQDEFRDGVSTVEVAGKPKAFSDAFKYMNNWRYKDQQTGEDIDLGKSKDWGPDTVLVLDSLTAMGMAAMNRARNLSGRTIQNTRDTDWGVAIAEQSAFIKAITSTRHNFHVVVIAHLKMVGPQGVRKEDEEITQKFKKEQAELISTRLYPSALGRAYPQEIGRDFPIIVLSENKVLPNGHVKRILQTVPREELDLKVPLPALPKDLRADEDGLLRLFEALSGPKEDQFARADAFYASIAAKAAERTEAAVAAGAVLKVDNTEAKAELKKTPFIAKTAV